MKTIKNITSDVEREFYASKDIDFENITIDGPLDGESAFKESNNISVKDSHFKLRYPFWHNKNLAISSSVFYPTSRAALWYCENINIKDTHINGVKAIRESNYINLNNLMISSEEFCWRCSNIKVNASKINGFYAFFESKNVDILQIDLIGKYSFQYCENLTIKQSTLNTKDAFWHSKNTTVIESIIDGEYLGWYSENLTLIRCHIKGTQPLCYCKNLKLVDCTFSDADLAFEYSEVNGNIVGSIVSVKNPHAGHITADAIGEIITEDSVMENTCRITVR